MWIQMERIAFLIIPDWQKNGRTQNQSFDGVGNTGAYVIIHQLRRAGIDVGFCTIDTADEFDVVCISVTSSFDILSLCKELRFNKKWRRGVRKFRTICGGAGLKNPFPLLEYVDRFWFGRCDTEAVQWVTDKDYQHPSIMDWDNPRECVVNQASCLFPEDVRTGKELWREKFIGCPNKCGFCFYSWTHRNIQQNEHYMLKVHPQQMEIDLQNWDLLNSETIVPHVAVGVDGSSGRIRCAINKKITDEALLELILRHNRAVFDKVGGNGNAYTLQLYNITGYETECHEDYSRLYEVLRTAAKEAKGRVLCKIHSTPLSPEPLTPLAWSAAPLRTPFGVLRGQTIVQTPKFEAFHNKFNTSDWQQFVQLVFTRYSDKYEKLLDNILFNPKLKALKTAERLSFVENHFDIGDLLREYDTEERLPHWPMAYAYTEIETLKNIRKSIKRKLYAKTEI
jgi:hypothetical protein